MIPACWVGMLGVRASAGWVRVRWDREAGRNVSMETSRLVGPVVMG